MSELFDYLEELRGRQGRREETTEDDYLTPDECGACANHGGECETWDARTAQEYEDSGPDPLDV